MASLLGSLLIILTSSWDNLVGKLTSRWGKVEVILTVIISHGANLSQLFTLSQLEVTSSLEHTGLLQHVEEWVSGCPSKTLGKLEIWGHHPILL